MATYYINADTGNDTTGNGSISLPWLTLSKANTSAAAGDTIIVMSATNTYALPCVTTYMQAKAGLRIVGQDKATCIFDGGGASMATIIDITSNNSLCLEWRNLTFRNWIEANVERGPFDYRSISGTSYVEITNCIIHNIQTLGAAGAQGLLNMSPDSPNAKIILTNCLIYDLNVSVEGTLAGQRTVQLHLINTVVANRTSQLLWLIQPRGGANGTIVSKNSIVANLSTGTIDGGSNRTLVETITYSCFYNLTSNIPTLGTGCITTNPLFVDFANADFRLRPSSPCIGTGNVS